ncbi:MAG TPA: hypothetical protein VGB07_02810 [Blastocatellia bacterium]
MKQTLSQFAARFKPSIAGWLKHSRQLVIGLLLLQVAVVAIAVWQIKRRAERELDAARSDLARQAFVPFAKRTLPAISGDGVTLMQSSQATRSLAHFNNSYFAATDGGLLELSAEGKLKRRFTVLDGLPESDLTALAAFGGQLFIGTRSQGLVAFDGSRFTAYRWTDRKAQAVTALVEDRGRLLIGTFAGGSLEFDGKQFRELKAGAEQKRLIGIDRLVIDDSRLFVGTFADGLWVNEGSRWQHFTVADGLPSNRVVGVVAHGEQLLVATDFGVAAAPGRSLFDPAQKSFQTLATLPSLSSLVRFGNSILLSKDNGEVFQLVADARTKRMQLDPILWQRSARVSESLSSCQLNVFSGEPSLWLLSNEGIRRTGWQGEGLSAHLKFTRFGESDDSNQPSDNLISALAFDDTGNLWAGSFRSGIDVFTREGRRLTHLESEAVREINSLVWDEAAKQILAGTSQGLVRFNGFRQAQSTNAADGLISNSILHAAPIQTRSSASSAHLVLATSRGLAFGQEKQWRALTAVQGLPSNSVYAVLPHRESIYAGTLGGLAQLNAGRVVRTFKDSNSKLTHNWVTALCTFGGRLFVGTYGGGVFELTPSGELVSFTAETGKLTVNPNAMTCDGERLYVGTLDGAWVLDFDSGKWNRLKSELPSASVMSVASDGENIYFGTTSGIARVSKKHLELVRE